MIGAPLSQYPDELRKVPAHLAKKPIRSFNPVEAMGERSARYMKARFEKTDDSTLRQMPARALTRLSLDQLSKIRYSSIMMMERSVEDLFEQEPRYFLVQKIQHSMWCWGSRRGTWNEIVDAHRAITAFQFGEGFEVTLDHTTWWNECGPSQHSRTCLDGVFAYLIHYRGEHVMTLGFSIAGNRQLLIQQIQLKKRRGNRWLYRLPENYVEYAVGRFQQAFPLHKLYMADGGEVAGKSLKSYRDSLNRALTDVEKYANDNTYNRLEKARAAVIEYGEKVAHLSDEVPRLAVRYRNSGRYEQGRAKTFRSMTHYRVEFA